MKNSVIYLLAGIAIGTALGSAAQTSVDRSRMATARSQIKTLATKIKNENVLVTIADRDELLLQLSYAVVGEE